MRKSFFFHESIDAVRITFPAVFKTSEKNVLRDAAQMAGFRNVELLEEPVAAALGYASIHEVGTGILVYDIGGGTLDLAYVRHEKDGTWRIPIPPRGISSCGGNDFDQQIYEWLERQLPEGQTFSGDSFRVDAEVLYACRNAKETLSKRPSASLMVFHQNQRFTQKIERSDFEKLIRNKILLSINEVKQLLSEVDS